MPRKKQKLPLPPVAVLPEGAQQWLDQVVKGPIDSVLSCNQSSSSLDSLPRRPQMTKLVADPNMKNLKIGYTYKGGKVINMGTIPAFQSGSRGWAKLPVKPE